MEKVYPVLLPSAGVPGQFIYHPPERVGSGIMRFDTFASGLSLVYLNLHLKKNICFVAEKPDWGFGFCFNLKGYSRVRASTLQSDFIVEPGKTNHFFFPENTVLAEEFWIGQKSKLSIVFDTNVLYEFAKDDEQAFLPFLQGLKDQIPFSDYDRILPEMHQTIKQILACPYTGKSRALFLESKTLELMAYKLEQIRYRKPSPLRQCGIRPYDIERIRHAAGRLLHDPINPPDITTLAAEAGMSRSKFYRCYKQVFGHSPLDHLRNHRLHLAKSFLSKGKHNVTEAAFAVGYNNLSHFTKIFIAQFGVPPHKLS